MLASLSEPPVTQQGLVYEPKYDGIRAIVEVRPGGGVTIYSRNGIDKTAQFPGIAAALVSLGRLPVTLLGLLINLAAVEEGREPLPRVVGF